MLITIKDLSASFLEFLKTEKQYSLHTIKSYQRDLANFVKFIRDENFSNFGSIEFNQCRQYLYFLEQRGYSRKSIARIIACKRSFWKYLIYKKQIDNNPWELLKTPKIAKKLPHILDKNEMKSFLEEINTETEIGLRDRTILELIYSAGLRISECVGLNLDNIDFGNHEILVVGKGKKERIVIFGNLAWDYLKQYLKKVRKLWVKKETPAIFLNTHGTRITTRSIQRIIKSYCKKQKIVKKVTPHTFRHSFATDLLNGGADLKVVQELLGHQSLSTTQIYTHLSQEKLIRTYKKAHPRA